MGKLETDEEMYLSTLKARAFCGLKQADMALNELKAVPEGMLRKIYFKNPELECFIGTPEYEELNGETSNFLEINTVNLMRFPLYSQR